MENAIQKQILIVPVDKVEPNDWNPNVMALDEYIALKTSVEAGEYDPIIVSPFETFYGDTKEKLTVNGDYVIVDGEHRWKAAAELDQKEILIEVRELTEDDAKPLNYKRNRQRGHMDPLREAKLFASELDKPGMTQEVIADRFNISRQLVAARISLLKLDEITVKLFTKPEETYKELVTESYEAKKAEVEQRIEVLKEGGAEEYEINRIRSWQMPDEPEEEELAPRGALTQSHLELIATLPKEEQAAVSAEVLQQGWSVRQTERQVNRIKGRLVDERKLREALETAKRAYCPDCSGDPEGFPSYAPGPVNNYFRCSDCSTVWDHTKTQIEVDGEKLIEEEKKKEERRQQRKESRGKTIANPNHIRRLETPTELSDKTVPWVFKKMMQLTRIKEIEVEGYRLNPETGEEEQVDIRFKPATTDSANVQSGLEVLIATYDFKESGGYRHQKRTNTFGFSVEGKEYKRTSDRSRVNIYWGDVNPTMRALLNAFFNETVETDKDPWWCKEDIEKSEMADVDEGEEAAIDKEEYEADPLMHVDTGEVLSYEEKNGLDPIDPSKEALDNKFDPILAEFIGGENDTVEVIIEGIDAEDTVLHLEDRIKERSLNVQVYEGEDGKVYLEKGPEVRYEETEVTRWLKGTVKDVNWKANLAKATVEDLKYMLERDDRKTAIRQYRKRLRELGEDG